MKAGVLLYTMVIAMIFGLVLEVYLKIRVDNAYNLKAEKQYLTAQVLATITQQQQAKVVRTDKGTATNDDSKITVVLTDGSIYKF